jgi:tRNA(Phe) wybutosine-synthesizing methylase Tyw3
MRKHQIEAETPSDYPFEQEKSICVEKLENNVDDKSRAGKVDAQIVPFVNTLNSLKDYYTTSRYAPLPHFSPHSCAGRIIIVQTTPNSGYNVDWLFVSHDFVEDPLEMMKSVRSQLKTEPGAEVWYKVN